MATYIDGFLVPEGLSDTEFKYWSEAQDAKRQLKEAVEYWKWVAFLGSCFWSGASAIITRIMFG